eukprot:scaffold3972_cov95-Isochrysis_galbana.AAC.1
MVPGSSEVSQRLLCLVLRARKKVGVGVACFKAVLKAHPTVYGRLIGSCVGASSVGLKRAGSADPVSGRNGCRHFARLDLRLFCLLLVPGAKECPQAPQDDVGRETPERKGFRKSQVGVVGWLTARAGRPGLWTYLIAVGCLRDGCLAGPGIEPPSAAVRVGERCHPSVGTRHVGKPNGPKSETITL